MNRRKIRARYRRFLRYYDFDLKYLDKVQAVDVLRLIQSAKHLATE